MRDGRSHLYRTSGPALVLFLLAFAFEPRAQAGHHTERARKAADDGRDARKARIAITIAGDPDCGQSLRALLEGQLADLASEVTWSCRTSFDADEPFRRGPRAGEDARVWVDLSTADEARLTLQDGNENRFFLRRLSLARGLDEISREEIAEVVRSATMAVLSGGTGGLTRAEAKATASRWPAPPPRPASRTFAPSPVQEDQTITARLPEVPSRPPFRIELGPTWTMQSLARKIPMAQELGLSVSLSRRDSRLSVWMESGYRLPASYTGDSVGVRVTALTIRAGVALWSSADRPFRVGVGGGIAAKRIAFSPEGNATFVDPAAADHFDVLAGRARLAFRLQPSPWLVLGLDLLCDIATADVHFDLRDADGAVQRVLTQWPVQPGLSFVAAWRWGQ